MPLDLPTSPRVEAILKDCVFVAHNVGFDYAFIRGHFEAMDRSWQRPKLAPSACLARPFRDCPGMVLVPCATPRASGTSTGTVPWATPKPRSSCSIRSPRLNADKPPSRMP